MLTDDLQIVHVNSLEGLGSSYRISGFFEIALPEEKNLKIDFTGIAFGGIYGGHNVNVELKSEDIDTLTREKNCTTKEIGDLITEVQRRLLNNEMKVDFDSLQGEEPSDGLGI